MKLKMLIAKVECFDRHGDVVGVSCQFKGHQYHFWMNPQTLKVDETLFKNPLPSIERNAPGFYHTRKLKTDKHFGRALIAAMLEVYEENKLYQKLQAKEKAEAEKMEAQQRKAHQERMIQEAAPELYEALKEVVRLLPSDQDKLMKLGLDSWIYSAKAALDKAEDKL